MGPSEENVRAMPGGAPTVRRPVRAGRRVVDLMATAAMGSWVVLAVMPVVVVIVALT